ncbi:TPA: hypothetical protein ACPOUB_001873, partial [Haemophilus influenzae]
LYVFTSKCGQFDAYFHSTKHLIAFVQSRFYAKQVLFLEFPFPFPLFTFPSCLLRLSLENLLFSACFQFFKEQLIKLFSYHR